MLHLSEEEFQKLQEEDSHINTENESDITRNRSRAVGTKSLSTGKAFEELIQLACRRYLDEGKACIMKTPEPFAVFSRTKDGMFTGRFTAAKAQPDFQGVIAGGRSLIFEAKHTSKDRILQSAVTPTQSKILDDHITIGGLSFVAVSLCDRNFFVPWSVWREMKEMFGYKHAKEEDLSPYEVLPDTGNPFPFLKKICE